MDLPVLCLPAATSPCRGCCDLREPVGPPPADPVARAVHRWVLGHHGAFLAWRFLADALRRNDVRCAVLGYDTYSSMLEYSGSCTREVYEEAIRPLMTAAHPAFSGRWARDYEPIPALLRTARAALGRERAAPLTAASRRNLLAHQAVVRKLVPGGPSLLRGSGRDVHAPPTDHERDLFDEFFLVSRGPCCERRYRAQVRRVFAAILVDVP
ncbi:L-tyrosine 3-hydroxylase [Lentzea tibetensis]|uniref:L-tyrosine 3-hydroxylase n=1 Tax=Lentzea tibetensis TaxID=2591470 RepID=A0A563EJY3_9PSEU|nr:L-tyrosine 3-hydroxylase [Lentzea tibetensis]TWP47253.1 L-tyrosine 3-hydroxylase [Lentzea tibetensis]